MPTPADMLAAMICLVALAAAHDRRHAAMAAWFGVALALSGWAMLAAPLLLFFAVANRAPSATAPIALLTGAGATLALRAAGLPHAAESLDLATVLAIASTALVLLAGSRLAHPSRAGLGRRFSRIARGA